MVLTLAGHADGVGIEILSRFNSRVGVEILSNSRDLLQLTERAPRVQIALIIEILSRSRGLLQGWRPCAATPGGRACSLN